MIVEHVSYILNLVLDTIMGVCHMVVQGSNDAVLQRQQRFRSMSTRLQIPAYTDRWMMGDRFGTLIKIGKPTASEVRKSQQYQGTLRADDEIAHVKLDSGKVVRVLLADCIVY